MMLFIISWKSLITTPWLFVEGGVINHFRTLIQNETVGNRWKQWGMTFRVAHVQEKRCRKHRRYAARNVSPDFFQLFPVFPTVSFWIISLFWDFSGFPFLFDFARPSLFHQALTPLKTQKIRKKNLTSWNLATDTTTSQIYTNLNSDNIQQRQTGAEKNRKAFAHFSLRGT